MKQITQFFSEGESQTLMDVPTDADISKSDFQNFLLQLKNQRSGSKSMCVAFLLF